MRHGMIVTVLGACLLMVGGFGAVLIPICYYDVPSMLKASVEFALAALLPGLVGWGLLKRLEIARRAAVLLFGALGLLMIGLGIRWVGLSLRIYRSLLVGIGFLLLAGYLHRESARREFEEKEVLRPTLL